MKLKTIDVQVDGKTVTVAVLDSAGLPVYVHEDGKEIGFDAAGATSRITALNGEAKTHREAKEKAEGALKAFEGIADPAAAIKALETVANLDQGQLVTAGKVEEIKAAAKKAAEEQVAAAVKGYEDQLTERTGQRDTLQTQLNTSIKGNAFGNSKFVQDKVAVPRPMLEKTYGDHFKVEEGKLVPYDTAGNKIYSRANPGEVAEFDEALEIIISSDPYKDHILKGQVGAGGGASQPGGGQGGGKTISRAEFAKLSPTDQMTKVTKDGFTVTD